MSRIPAFLERILRTRNIGVLAHVDAGKTTTTAKIEFLAGTNHITGKVDDGNTTTDYLEQERIRGITIQSAAVSFRWRDHDINLIDTPGHVDFTMEVERSLRVLDGIVLVLCAKGGVQPQTRTVWRQSNKHRVPRVIFVNKMDTMGADFYRVVSQVENELKAKPAVVQLPIGSESTFVGVIDLVSMKALVWESSDSSGASFTVEEIPEAMADEAQEWRNKLVEAIAETDDELLEKYLDDSALSEDELKSALRKATIDQKLIPMLCGSAFKHKGVQPLLDAVVDYLPSPEDVGTISGTVSDGTEVERSFDSPELTALAFKVTSINQLKLTFVRVYSGTIEAGSYVKNSREGVKERVSRLVKLQGNQVTNVDKLEAGEIGAIVGLKATRTGDTLCGEKDTITLESINCPDPVISVSVEPKDRDNAKKMDSALSELVLEDPSIQRYTDEDTGEVIIAGQGELHLDVTLDRLRSEHGVELRTGKPRVSYRETAGAPAKEDYTHKKQTGGSGQFARVVLELEPLPKGEGFVFEDKITGGVIPKEYIPSVEKGIRGALSSGVVGFPIIDIKVSLVFGATHDVDSSNMAFETAGAQAFKQLFAKAQPVLLEPTMTLVIEVPEEHLGDVIGDVNQRRGKVSGEFENTDGIAKIDATVPLSETFGYSTALRSKTTGRGTFTLEFSHYERVPESIVEAVKAGAAK